MAVHVVCIAVIIIAIIQLYYYYYSLQCQPWLIKTNNNKITHRTMLIFANTGQSMDSQCYLKSLDFT